LIHTWRTILAAAVMLLAVSGCVPQRPAEIVKATPEPLDPYRMVRAHNVWRTRAGLPGLHWSKKLADKAADRAEKLAREGCTLKHSGGEYGENLFWESPLKISTNTGSGGWRQRNELPKVTEQEVVDSWAAERQWYSHQTNTCNAPAGKGCGHYTQLVWKNTREVGCARAICPDNAQIWVCLYDPPGNYIGEMPY